MKPTRRMVLIILAVAFVGLVAIRIISHFSTANTDAAQVDPTLIVRVEQVTIGELIDEVKISGTIRAIHDVDIYPKIDGRVLALNFNVGDSVKAGDVLAVIEHQEISLQEKSARASLAMARTNENAAKKDALRAHELFLERAMAKAELEAIEQKYDVAKAQALAALAQADIAAQQLKNSRITSLIDGIVTKRTIAIGANVSPKSPSFTVQDLSKLKLVTSVDAATLPRLKKGMEAMLTVLQLDTPIRGRVASVAPSLDAQSRRAEVEIEIDDHNNSLVPNMFIDGALVLDKMSSAVLVPNRAVITTDNTSQVFRIHDGKAALITVKLGKRDAHSSAVIDGLNAGDTVAISGLDRLRDGIAVSVEMAK